MIPDQLLFPPSKIKLKLLGNGLSDANPMATFEIPTTTMLEDSGVEVPDILRALADTELVRSPAYRAVRQLLIDTAVKIEEIEPEYF